MAKSDVPDAYAQHQALYNSASVPQHVAANLVVDFDYLHPPGMDHGDDVYSAWKRLHDGPDIVWTPRNGGHWIVTRGEDVKFVQEHFEIFSHEEFTIPRGATPVIMPPLTVDPPNHARYRAILNPAFTPSRVKTMREKAVQVTAELVAELQPKGACDFVGDFARIMPVTMFLGIVDLPLDRRREFCDWAYTFMFSTDSKAKLGALDKVTAYLAEKLDEREAEPGDDLLSRIVSWRKNPRFQGEAETMGMAIVTFFGGLDTVANMLSFTTRHLAQHPALRRRLIDEPDLIPQAAEEFFRRFGLSNTGRLVLADHEYKGVLFKKDEMVMVPIALSSMDDRLYENPMEIDFDRNVGQNGHNTFGNGPHKCVGSPLARAELHVFLEEWLKQIPEFRLDPDHSPVTHSGSVNGMNSLYLRWD